MKCVVLAATTGTLVLAIISLDCYYYKGRRVAPEILTRSLDKSTPAGAVPPVTEQPQSAGPAPGVVPGQHETSPGVAPIGQGDLLTGRVIGGKTVTGVDWSGTISRFQIAYKAHGSPRMAVLLNRVLSDEVRDWAVDEALILRYKDSQGNKELELHEVRGIEGEGARPSPAETWMWAFEDGFVRPYLEAEARLVDRATVMRLQAARKQAESGTLTPIAVKEIETAALKGHTDIFVELLVSRDPRSHWGYHFKATAKSTTTGEILASVTSTSWETALESQTEVVATPNDYQVVREWKLPTLDDVSRTLALELMSSLASYWR